MKENYLFGLVVGAIVVCVITVGLLLAKWDRKHDYLVVCRAQTNGAVDYQLKQLQTSGPRFTLADANWVTTNVLAGNTNMTVIILNIIKLDN